MLTGKQKRFLRGRANRLRPIATLGKNGLSDQFVDSVAKALEARELVKVSLLPTAEETPDEVGAFLSRTISGAQVAQTMGRTVLLYRRSTQEAHRKLSVEVAKLGK
ncbi:MULTISPECIES: ribosome assembly RNA-binding protein YhbY [unclassified Lacticaseibacillus]|uniref:ribosome assembly RNA-binding protein YhbY n=1 Tax=unclassified Lacticaseibacillus TaxID=2759744 RepID=UPI001941D2F3|nr:MULTISPECIES: ribosome assembly RNA-binding protein YhbY [unclassified Lacticaseibacillus]